MMNMHNNKKARVIMGVVIVILILAMEMCIRDSN